MTYNDYNINDNNDDNNDYFDDADNNNCNVILRKEVTITLNNKFMAKLIKKHFMRGSLQLLGTFFLGSFS